MADYVARLVLSHRQNALIHALSQRSSMLSDMFVGALATMEIESNPDRVAQAAHSIRELFEKLPRQAGVEFKSVKPRLSLTQRVTAIGVRYDECKAKSASFNILGAEAGIVDSELTAFFTILDNFIAEFRQDHPQMRVRIAAVLASLEGPVASALPRIVEAKIKRYRELSDYFQNVSHHRSAPPIAAFVKRLNDVEEFFIALFAPRPFDDLNELDELISR